MIKPWMLQLIILVFDAPSIGRGCITYSVRSFKCQVSGAGQRTVKFKCPLREGCNACSCWAIIGGGVGGGVERVQLNIAGKVLPMQIGYEIVAVACHSVQLRIKL